MCVGVGVCRIMPQNKATVLGGGGDQSGYIPHPQGCIRRKGASEAAPEAVSEAVGGGCQSGWGRLLSFINAIEAGTKSH